MPLTAEQARERLDSIADPQWRTAARKRIQRLWFTARGPAKVLLDPLPDFAQMQARQAHEKALQDVAAKLDEMPEKRLVDVLSAVHPGLGPALARWWVASQTQPFQRSWDRRAYRATGQPQLTRPARARELGQLIHWLGPYNADPAWLAAWAGYLSATPAGRAGLSANLSGGVLAAAIDLGGADGEAALSTLINIGNGDDPVGVMGRHVVVGLLRSSDVRGWDFVERLLLAAQRQEGLRQVILEAADEAHPAAFDRMLQFVLDHKLLRFAAAVRAAGVWLGFSNTVEDIPQVTTRIQDLLTFRTNPVARQQALSSGDAWQTHTALAAAAMQNVMTAVDTAEKLLKHPDRDVRAAVVRFLSGAGLIRSQKLLSDTIVDTDTAVGCLAVHCLGPDGVKAAHTFSNLEQLLRRLPEKAKSVENVGVEQTPVKVSQTDIAPRLIPARGDRPIGVLLPWLPVMDANGRVRVTSTLAQERLMTPQVQAVLLQLLADRSSTVRNEAAKALKGVKLGTDGAESVEALLTRTATDVRRAALSLLAGQSQKAALASADRLAASSDPGQRAAAAELRRTIGAPAAPAAPGAPASPVKGRSKRTSGSTADAGAESVEAPADVAPVDARAVLLDPAKRTPARQPQLTRTGTLGSSHAIALINVFDKVTEEHNDDQVTLANWQGSRELLLADVRWFPSPFIDRPMRPDLDDENAVGLVLSDVFHAAFESRPNAARGSSDALDVLRGYVTAHLTEGTDLNPFGRRDAWNREILAKLLGTKPVTARHPNAVRHVFAWLLAEIADASVIAESLDGLEAFLTAIPNDILEDRQPKQSTQFAIHYPANWMRGWRQSLPVIPWFTVLRGLLNRRPELFTTEHLQRWYALMRWVEQPRTSAPIRPIESKLLTAAYDAGVATDADVIAAFLNPQDRLFSDLTRRWRTPAEERHPKLVALADQVREQVVAAELTRGDLPTSTSQAARNVSSISGADLVTRLLAQLGKTSLVRGYSRGSDSRDAVLSHLIRVCFPAEGDTGELLRHHADTRKVSIARLRDLAVYAPQWAALVEAAVEAPGLADAVLWLHAHTKDEQWSVDLEIRQSWAAMTAELTPLNAEDLTAGAVDVEWFQRSHTALGEDGWAALDKAAKHASSGGGHRRAQLFAQAMLGQATDAEIVERITSKRHQDSVRSLGLIPLATDTTTREQVLQERYRVLREFERGSRQFGSQRQASEGAAVRIGIDNLARTAGYPDPQRFIWAMEALEAGDLADGPVATVHGDVTVTLLVTPEGDPDLTIERAGKTLQAVPAALRKTPEIVELRSRKTQLKRQAARVRRSLEQAMIAADTFTTVDLDGLRRHPLVSPMLDQLIWVDTAGTSLRRVDGMLRNVAGKTVKAKGELRIAYPTDLVADGSWVGWQEQLFDASRRQPFKQAFRELYALTSAEKATSPVSSRYEGHQLQPRQALALLGSRGWLTDRESGDTSRVFHQYGLVARLQFIDGFLTPQEADLPTVGGVLFTKRGERFAQPLADIPPIVFSETMRDLDLVVSVAHAGGVDPEATASTTEMRGALVRETARLLRLDNVRYTGEHVLIDGKLGEYSVHLGSAVVHRRPGGSVCIVPVGSQHRGRLFLPFADDDPKTAEVVAKVVLLAKDHEIKDPTILEQLHD